MACLYSRPEGASQREVNDVSAKLGSPQIDYRNMLRAAQEWGHQFFVWHDARRGGYVYKLRYNPENKATLAVPRPDDWEEANQLGAPAAAIISEWA